MKITEDYLKIVNAKFFLRFKGYCFLSRSRYFLYINKDLNDSEFILYSLLFDTVADWDSRHTEYGMFGLNYDLLSQQIGWSASKLRRTVKSLLDKRYIEFLADRKYIIPYFDLQKSITIKGFNFYQELKGKRDGDKVDKSFDKTEINDTEDNR